MRQVDHRIKKRRDERIRSLRQQHSPWPNVPGKYSGRMAASRGVEYPTYPLPSQKRDKKRSTKLIAQSAIAIALFAFTYFIFQTDTAMTKPAQAFITEVMERDFNFQGAQDWYEARFGSVPAIIPTFNKRSEPVTQNSLRSNKVMLPVQGQVVERYSEDHPYVTLNGSDGGQVKAGAEGLVSFVGEKEGWGNCVILQHTGGMETWYGPLSSVQVELSDWVQVEDLLGQITDLNGTVQFGVKQGGSFVDPFDVIKVD